MNFVTIIVTCLLSLVAYAEFNKTGPGEFGPESSIGLIPARNGQPLNLSSLSDPLRDTTTQYYIFLRNYYWHCLTCDCASGNNGANLFTSIAYCYPTANQLFYLIPTDGSGIYVDPEVPTSSDRKNGTRAAYNYRIVNARDERCLDIYNGPGDSDGAVVNWVVTNECGSSTTQQWILNEIAHSKGYQYYTIQNVAVTDGNGYITTRSMSTTDGALLHLWGLGSSPDWTQEWAYTT